jgi:hypothetical protein
LVAVSNDEHEDESDPAIKPLANTTLSSAGLKFSCHTVQDERINDVSVKALLAARGDFLPLARVGTWFLACSIRAFVSCKKNVLVDEAKASGLTTVDFLQSAAGVSDHGKQRQANV